MHLSCCTLVVVCGTLSLCRYYFGELFTTRAIRLDRHSLFQNSAGDNPLTISYRLQFTTGTNAYNSRVVEPPGEFLVGASGSTLANLTQQGDYSAQLLAVDGAGSTATVLEWAFEVVQRDPFRIKPSINWNVGAEIGIMPSVYFAGEAYETDDIRFTRTELFENYRDDDATQITYHTITNSKPITFLMFFQNGAKKPGFEMCFAIGSQHLWCRRGGPNQNQNKTKTKPNQNQTKTKPKPKPKPNQNTPRSVVSVKMF